MEYNLRNGQHVTSSVAALAIVGICIPWSKRGWHDFDMQLVTITVNTLIFIGYDRGTCQYISINTL